MEYRGNDEQIRGIYRRGRDIPVYPIQSAFDGVDEVQVVVDVALSGRGKAQGRWSRCEKEVMSLPRIQSMSDRIFEAHRAHSPE